MTQNSEEASNASLWLRLGFAALVSGQSMVFSLASNLTPPEGEERWLLHGVLAFSSLVVFLLIGGPLVKKAVGQALRGRVVVEQLFLLGILAAFAASVQSTITGREEIYYEVVAILLAIYTLGDLVGQNRRQAALRTTERLKQEFDVCVRMFEDGSEERVSVREISLNDRIRVHEGGGIPVDGKVLEGRAYVRETALTGEPFPVVKRPGDLVMAGSQALDSGLIVGAVSSGESRKLDELISAVQQARLAASPLQKEADRITSWFLPVVILISVGTFYYWWPVEGLMTALFFALAVIIVACPCALGLATPIGIWNALDALARRGVVARMSDFIERCASVDVVVFDKTGTLSDENLVVVDFVAAKGWERQELKSWVGAVEAESDHPVARAFMGWSDGRRVREVEILAGRGVAGTIEQDGKVWRVEVGNEDILKGDSPEVLREQLAAKDRLKELFVLVDGKLAGMALMRESLRESSREAMDELRKMGVQVEVMTGDRSESVAALGLEGVQSGLLPEEKKERVAAMQKSGKRVLFVGDGVNDSPALTEAHASLALSEGAGMARETAHAELFGANLGAVPEVLKICRSVVSGIRGNIAFAAFYNFVGITLAACGLIHPVLAAILMMASSLTVTWRALRMGEALHEGESVELVPLRGKSVSEMVQARWQDVLAGVALGIQAPMLIYMGALDFTSAAWLGVFFVGAGCALTHLLPKWRQRVTLATMLGMFALGNVGMLIGWSAEAGWGAVVRDGVCLCACPNSVLGWGIVGLNSMQLGMLLASIPVVLLFASDGTSPLTDRRSVFYWAHLLVCFAGMVAGMELGAVGMLMFPVGDPAQQFLLTFMSMSMGMGLGMLLSCQALLWSMRTFIPEWRLA